MLKPKNKLKYKDEILDELKGLTETELKDDLKAITIKKYTKVYVPGKTKGLVKDKIAVIPHITNAWNTPQQRDYEPSDSAYPLAGQIDPEGFDPFMNRQIAIEEIFIFSDPLNGGSLAGGLCFLDVTDDLVNDLGVSRHVEQFHGAAKHNPALLGDTRDVDNLCIRQGPLQFRDTALDKALLFTRRVILGVFFQIAVIPGRRDSLDNFRPLD